MATYIFRWCRTGSNLDNEKNQKWLPTLCVGFALGVILRVELEFKSGYIHFLLGWISVLKSQPNKTATYTLCWCCTESTFAHGIQSRTWLPTLCAGFAPCLISKLKCWPKRSNIHFALVSHWVQLWCWIVNQEASTYTLCWCRTGSNFDGGIWSWKWQHTLCAGVCIWFDIELQEKATMVPGVALGQHWIVDFQCKSGDLHSVLVSHWI